MEDERPIEEILDAIGDPKARIVLAAISKKRRSAKELSEDLGMSQATVYRRLETLSEHDLIKSQTLVAEDGNHYDEFECNFNSTIISLEGDEYDVRIFREENLPDRFNQLWDDLAGGL